MVNDVINSSNTPKQLDLFALFVNKVSPIKQCMECLVQTIDRWQNLDTAKARNWKQWEAFEKTQKVGGPQWSQKEMETCW